MRVVKALMVVFLVTCGLAICSTSWSQPSAEQAKKTSLRVGTFDSRALVIAFANSEMWNRRLAQIKQERDKAKAAGDDKKVKELEDEFGPGRQDRMHQQGFSTAPVDDILEEIKDKLPEIAKEANVDLIVSKWAVTYQVPGAEFVDVTDLMCKPFSPNERAQRWIKECVKQTPVPLYKLKMDTNE